MFCGLAENCVLYGTFGMKSPHIKSSPFKKKSTFHPKGKDAAIELYLRRLEEEIMATDTKLSHSNLNKEECLAHNLLEMTLPLSLKRLTRVWV